MRKKAIFSILFLSLLIACTSPKSNSADQSSKDYLEVIYFHTRTHDALWDSIKVYTQKVLNNDFAKQLADNKITFENYDLGTSGGARTADKFNVKGASLIINEWKNKKVIVHNLTNFANKTSSNPSLFEQGFKKQVKTILESD